MTKVYNLKEDDKGNIYSHRSSTTVVKPYKKRFEFISQIISKRNNDTNEIIAVHIGLN